MEALDYNKLAEAIAAKLYEKQVEDHTLWDGQQCADYLRQSFRNFRDRVSKHHTFPTPVRAATINGRGTQCWYAKEVIQWAAKQR